MGTYLATGLVTTISVSGFESAGLTHHDVFQILVGKYEFSMDIYDIEITGTSIFLNLKMDVLCEQLITFLECYYAIMYHDQKSSEEAEKLLESLKTQSVTEWLIYAKEKSSSLFQYDTYGETDILYFHDKPFRKKVEVCYQSILLSMEGKVSIESHDKHFKFFKHCMLAEFKSFTLAHALRVYITG